MNCSEQQKIGESSLLKKKMHVTELQFASFVETCDLNKQK